MLNNGIVNDKLKFNFVIVLTRLNKSKSNLYMFKTGKTTEGYYQS